jgi:hypothetical protein
VRQQRVAANWTFPLPTSTHYGVVKLTYPEAIIRHRGGRAAPHSSLMRPVRSCPSILRKIHKAVLICQPCEASTCSYPSVLHMLDAAGHSPSHVVQAVGVQRTVVRTWARPFLA